MSLLIVISALAVGQVSVPDRIVEAAESFLGQPYVFGGRAGRRGCRDGERRIRCRAGIDCQSLIFFAYEKVLGVHWTRYSVMPSISVQRQRLGRPVKGLDGVLAADLDRTRLHKGDVLFFLLEEYNLDADPPLLRRKGRRYGVWHTGIVRSARAGVIEVIHAKPGHKVVIEALGAIEFDGLYVLRRSR